MTRLISLAFVLILPLFVFAEEKSPFKAGKHGPAELQFISGVPVLTVSGKPEEIGEQIGVLVGQNSPDPTPILNEFLKDAKIEKAFPALKLMARQLQPAFPKHILAEIETLSKKGNYDLDLLLFINTVYDLSSGMGCSTFVVEKDRSTTGQPLFGRNFDWLNSKGLPQQAMVVVYKPTGKHAFAAITISPITGVISGMNEKGLAITINEIHLKQVADKSNFDWKATPMLLLFRQVLEECATVEEAEKFLRNSKRTTAACLTVCDVRGGAVFEITPKNIEVRKATDNITCCTNHFCTELAKGEKKCWRLDKLIAAREKDGKVGVDDIFSTLHTVSQKGSTLQAMVFEPTERIIHLKIGDGKTSATANEAAKIELSKLWK